LQNFCEQDHVALLEHISNHTDRSNLMLMFISPKFNPQTRSYVSQM